MNLTELRTIPYWDEDEEDDMPDNIPASTTGDAPIAGNRYIVDEYGQFDFPSCFAERL